MINEKEMSEVTLNYITQTVWNFDPYPLSREECITLLEIMVTKYNHKLKEINELNEKY